MAVFRMPVALRLAGPLPEVSLEADGLPRFLDPPAVSALLVSAPDSPADCPALAAGRGPLVTVTVG